MVLWREERAARGELVQTTTRVGHVPCSSLESHEGNEETNNPGETITCAVTVMKVLVKMEACDFRVFLFLSTDDWYWGVEDAEGRPGGLRAHCGQRRHGGHRRGKYGVATGFSRIGAFKCEWDVVMFQKKLQDVDVLSGTETS